jgi:hypothetical protein
MNSEREESEFEKTLELLREAHREAIAEAHFAAVRARVLSQLAAERRPWWRGVWACGLAAAVAAAMLLAAFWPKHMVRPQTVGQALPPANRALDHAGHASPRPALQSVSENRTVGRRKRLPHNEAAYRVVGPPAPQHLVVKLVTNDPNVVIYWITGE